MHTQAAHIDLLHIYLVIGVLENAPHPPEGGLSAGAGSRESCGCWAHIMSHQIWQEGPLAEGFTQEVKS
jgi:hypothetical protein